MSNELFQVQESRSLITFLRANGADVQRLATSEARALFESRSKVWGINIKKLHPEPHILIQSLSDK